MRDTIIIIENDKRDFKLVQKTLGIRYMVYPECFRRMQDIISKMENVEDSNGGFAALFSLLREHYANTKAVLFDLYLSNDDILPSTSFIQEIRRYNNPEDISFSEFCKSVPIIAYTHSCSTNDEKEAMQYGATYFLKKPFNDLDIVKRKLLDKTVTTCISAHKDSFSVPDRIRKDFFKFKMNHVGQTTAFLMFAFKHMEIAEQIKKILKDRLNIEACIANDPGGKYDSNLLTNLETFMYGCDFGIGIYKDMSVQIYDSNSKKEPIINPNLSFEVGYMMALKKKVFIVCALEKDQKMPADISGLIHIQYNTETIANDIITAIRNSGIVLEDSVIQEEK